MICLRCPSRCQSTLVIGVIMSVKLQVHISHLGQDIEQNRGCQNITISPQRMIGPAWPLVLRVWTCTTRHTQLSLGNAPSWASTPRQKQYCRSGTRCTTTATEINREIVAQNDHCTEEYQVDDINHCRCEFSLYRTRIEGDEWMRP